MNIQYLLFSLLFVLLLSLQAYGQDQHASLRVMSYNIRYDTPNDGDDRWANRKERVAKLIHYHQPDLLGVQEALLNQLQDLQSALPQYSWYGAGREDGKEAGEYSAIFYNKDKFELIDKGTFWLSPQPELPSKGWDAAIIRICSWVKLKNKQTGKDFYHFNTHFDHKGEKARQNSAILLRERIAAIAGQTPVVLTGDFNTADDTPAYTNLTRGGLLMDSHSQSKTGHYGPKGTFSTFDVASKLGKRIDFIFVTKGFQVLQHAILTDAQQGKYPSDHLPVVAVLEPVNKEE